MSRGALRVDEKRGGGFSKRETGAPAISLLDLCSILFQNPRCPNEFSTAQMDGDSLTLSVQIETASASGVPRKKRDSNSLSSLPQKTQDFSWAVNSLL
jgi:hypothetical protein